MSLQTNEELAGKYESFPEMEDERMQELIGKKLIFEKPASPHLISSGVTRDWPDARGAYISNSETLAIWVNEDEHCGIVSIQKDGNMTEAFKRLCMTHDGIESDLKTSGNEYSHDDHLGYIMASPANLGSGLCASVQVKIPLLS